jgi:hypothetical protein
MDFVRGWPAPRGTDLSNAGAAAAFGDRLACTNEELIFLASLSGAQAVVGVEDPLRGRSEDEVEQALIAARERLIQRGYLVAHADGSSTPPPEVAELVETIAHPQRSYFAFLVTGSAADAVGTGERQVFHVRGSNVVRLMGDARQVEVVRLAGRRGIAEDVLAFWGVAQQPPAGATQAVLPQRALHEAARVAAEAGEDACRERLVAAGIDEEAAEELAMTLTRPRRNAALLAFAVDAQPGTTLGMGMLEGANGLWRLRPDEARGGEPYVRAAACAGPALAEIVRAFVEAT